MKKVDTVMQADLLTVNELNLNRSEWRGLR